MSKILGMKIMQVLLTEEFVEQATCPDENISNTATLRPKLDIEGKSRRENIRYKMQKI